MLNKIKKFHKAFTLAELMVIMAVLTVILAAVAPIFTSRYTNAAFDNVWSTVGASWNNDIYADAPGRFMMQQSLIGITPIDMEDIRRTYLPLSKVIVRSADKVGGNKQQKQIEFRYSNSKVGYLGAGNGSILLGGSYNDINFHSAAGNSAIGTKALNALTSGTYNSAIGYEALKSLKTGHYNTAIGVSSGGNMTEGDGNVLVGNNVYSATKGSYNTLIGNNPENRSSESNYTTAVGDNIYTKGDYNTALGYASFAGGKYNTAVGYGALLASSPAGNNFSNFQYNTAIGYKSCSGINSASKYTTCIGGSGVDTNNMSTVAQNFYKDTKERVLIGGPVSTYRSAATLEVHNLTSANSKYPYPDTISGASSLGDSSVVVNGNLIVRGQTYLIGKSPFPVENPKTTPGANANTISLMGFKLYKEALSSHKPLIGFDGSERTVRIKDDNEYIHEEYAGREHCICAYSCSLTTKDYYGGKGFYGRDAYDWTTPYDYDFLFDNSFYDTNYLWGTNPHRCNEITSKNYNDNVHSAHSIELDAARALFPGGPDASEDQITSIGSCCPVLTPNGVRSMKSDIRLKNVSGKFTFGFDKISKLRIYDYFFKSDRHKIPQVGVMAQDLKLVFPNAVSKDDRGYYKIRWDEMFYAAINSIKELNTKIVNLVARVENNLERINKLNKENKELEQELIRLSKEIDNLKRK